MANIKHVVYLFLFRAIKKPCANPFSQQITIDSLDLGRIESRRKTSVFTAIEENPDKITGFFGSKDVYHEWNLRHKKYFFFSADGTMIGWANPCSGFLDF